MRMLVSAVLVLCLLPAAQANMQITEWMYSGSDGEFFELTNTGASPVDMTGWSYDDDSQAPGTFDLSAFGTVQAGQSVIVAENAAATFATAWNLSGVSIIGGSTTNLGRNDEINIYDNGSALVDRLTFGDQNIPGTIRTQNASGWTTPANLGLNNVAAWQLSVAGDAQGSYVSLNGDIGNPGTYVAPEPITLGLLGLGLLLVRRR